MDRKTETSAPRRPRVSEDAGTAAGSPAPTEPDPEVVAKATRRRFTAAYKLRIVEEAEQCAGEPGAIGRLLRREGLYSSHLVTWRRAARDGSLAALSQKRGPKSRPAGEKRLARALAKAERENARLRDDLRKARLVLDVQGKVAGLLGLSFDGEKT